MAEIVLDHVVKRYPDGALAVDDFNLDIADGEFIILVGPSGCGKSTTLNMVAGLEDITAGKLIIDGNVVNDKAPKDRDIAMVFQSYALYPHMTVGENMGFPLKLAGVDKGTIQKKVNEAAEMLELTQHLDRKPSNLSGGQRQRVAMGRAIVRSAQGLPHGRAAVQPRRQAARADAHPGVADPEEPGHHHAVRHARPDRGHDARRPGRGHARRRGAAGRLAVVPLRPPGQPVRRRLHRQPVDELPARAAAGRRDRARRLWARRSCRDRCRQAVERSKSSGNVIMGIRPEHFEDASLVGDKPGATFDAPIDIVEAMGSDVFAYFVVKGEEAHSDQTRRPGQGRRQRPAQRRGRRSRPGWTPPRTSSAGRRPGSGTTPRRSRCSTPRPG